MVLVIKAAAAEVVLGRMMALITEMQVAVEVDQVLQVTLILKITVFLKDKILIMDMVQLQLPQHLQPEVKGLEI